VKIVTVSILELTIRSDGNGFASWMGHYRDGWLSGEPAFYI